MRRLLFLVSFLFITYAAYAGRDVTSYTLPNGLKLFVKEDHRSPAAILQVWYKVGSSYESTGITGISHALEHLMFQGTPQYGPGKLAQIIAANGGQNNAMTTQDYTTYYETLAADKLAIAFALEADRMRHLSLDPTRFTHEMQVVMEERRMRTDDSPQMLAYERFLAAANIATGYHHLPIGWMSDLQHLNVNDARAYYQKWYAPNNAILVVAGDVKPEAMYQLALTYFGPLKPSTLPEMKPQPEIPSLGERNVIVKVPAQLPFLFMGYNVPVLKTAADRKDAYALAVVAAILDGDGGRLTQALVRGKQIAASVDVDYDPFQRFDTVFMLAGTPSQGHTLAELKAGLLAEIQKLQTAPVSADELTRVKASVIADRVYAQDSIEDQATRIGRLEVVDLPWQLNDEFLKNVEAVSAQQIQAVAKHYFTTDNLTTTELQPLPIDQKSVAPTALPLGGEHVH